MTDVQGRIRAVAIGRIVLGASFVVAPGLGLRAWPGNDEARGPVSRLLARSVGVRDIALGMGTLLAVQHDTPARGWLEATMLADAGDAAAILLGFRHLPRVRAVAMLGASVGAAVAGRRLVSDLG
ncbi:MAG: hypothetical protein M3O23_11855 [Actinomycetota bacterium]|nr:hypothetical protein [Actinomycetota bacterium]